MEKQTIMLIDFSNTFYRAWHSSGDGPVSLAAQRTREEIARAAATVPGALVAVCLDSGRSFRKELCADYKAQRPERDATFLAEMDRCKEALRSAGYLLWAADGFEADDVIATAALAASGVGTRSASRRRTRTCCNCSRCPSRGNSARTPGPWSRPPRSKRSSV
jgi:DNA polymerase-1